jgi:predicted acylesterase/phospholipase RssA
MANNPSAAPADRYCDLVMKGGITSGVVYPPAIYALANEYRFKNIGGTSAGAIAAVVTAAAEYRRRHTGSMDGFKHLADLPKELGQTDKTGNTRLMRLFQPDRSCLRLFRILSGSLNKGGTFARIRAVVLSCIGSYWIAAAASVVLSILVGGATHSWHGGILFFLFTFPVFVGALIYFDVTRNLVGNDYGMCKGMTTNEKAGAALTPWLHQLIQDAAGLKATDPPLTFGDLWKVAGGPPPVANCSTGARSIDLKMFTTNLTHGRPYIFPHSEPTARLFYNAKELAAYLPHDVMEWFEKHGVDYVPNPRSPASDPPVEKAAKLGLKEVPPPEHFPILLAARMSLSFPILFSAVPLWAIDYEYERTDRTFRRCIFSDGGISSNFPMHLFDGLIPQWPTFGIELEDKVPGHKNMIFLPHKYLDGIADRWTRFDQQAKSASRMGGFLMSVVSAMQNWNDNMLSRMPGVRDRVVRVRLNKNEGGLNLNMPEPVIDAVAKRGGEAAKEIIDRFLGSVPPNGWDGWSSQRWVRLDVFISALSQKIGGMERALGPSVPHSGSYSDLLKLSQQQAPPGHDAPLNLPQAQALAALVQALDSVATAFGGAVPSYPNEPLPEPDFRVRPPL